ncbi:acyl carrier protein [Solimonas terrae]|uniref:Acyl carrier protein n=1 Tax=Solimonas terrae TaxID=1396819 RepID=A0A6M2BSE2_9GAMM|nr:acyl carrier protein [Solimonas terrae]NGY05274.1 acyl carrier protein [Solimonas terrae]
MTTASNELLQQLIALLDEFTQDWDREDEGAMTRETKLLADLGFESIDIIQLVVAIEEDITHRKVAFDQLLMNNGRYVDDLSIGQIADFLVPYMSAS